MTLASEATWTAERLEQGLIAAFRASPGLAVLTPRRGELLAALELDGAVTFDLVAAAYHCLGHEVTARNRADRLMLLTWARALARNGTAETSLRETCREQGWVWGTFLRRRHTAAAHVAEILGVAEAVAQTTQRLCALRTSATIAA